MALRPRSDWDLKGAVIFSASGPPSTYDTMSPTKTNASKSTRRPRKLSTQKPKPWQASKQRKFPKTLYGSGVASNISLCVFNLLTSCIACRPVYLRSQVGRFYERRRNVSPVPTCLQILLRLAVTIASHPLQYLNPLPYLNQHLQICMSRLRTLKTHIFRILFFPKFKPRHRFKRILGQSRQVPVTVCQAHSNMSSISIVSKRIFFPLQTIYPSHTVDTTQAVPLPVGESAQRTVSSRRTNSGCQWSRTLSSLFCHTYQMRRHFKFQATRKTISMLPVKSQAPPISR